MRLLCPALTLAMLAGCTSSATVTGSTEASATVVTDERQTKPWADLDFDERRAFMADRVLPAMSKLFTEHDAERFPGVGCATCHGEDRRERNFAMPNPSLPTLYPTGSAEQKATVEKHPEMATFMFEQVTPAMRELLGIPEYDEATGSGFSCFYCHPRGDTAEVP